MSVHNVKTTVTSVVTTRKTMTLSDNQVVLLITQWAKEHHNFIVTHINIDNFGAELESVQITTQIDGETIL